jgi:1,4-alpha-glucan branching enzyme
MGLRKRFLKSKPVCKVTFELPADNAGTAGAIHLVGEFNDWNTAVTPLSRLKNGQHKVTIDLATGRDYQFRYLVDDTSWINDPEADGYVPSGFPGIDNSVVSC